MPELPEVETTKRGIAPHVENQVLCAVETRCDMLRHRLDSEALQSLVGATITEVTRRGKHLILLTNRPPQALHLHLGMTGTLRICSPSQPYKDYDRVIFTFAHGQQMRLHDARKFGACARINLDDLPAGLKNLGVEPLGGEFDGARLFALTRGKRMAIKVFIMDQKFVLGVGNIYATEALFFSGIHPARPAGSLSRAECNVFASNIKQILTVAIAKGGTTLRDFASPDGEQGHFVQQLAIYGRAGQRCPKCLMPLEKMLQTGRTTVFCPNCQI